MQDSSKEPVPLEYSSLPEGYSVEKQIEKERREGIENYNLSTFGERHPYSIWPTAIMVVVLVVLSLFLPRWLFSVALIVATVFFVPKAPTRRRW
jgi:hypothetical protein